jgi:hypothetical protein
MRDEHVGGPVDHREQGPVPRRRRIGYRIRSRIRQGSCGSRVRLDCHMSFRPGATLGSASTRASTSCAFVAGLVRCIVLSEFSWISAAVGFLRFFFTQVRPAERARRSASRYRERERASIAPALKAGPVAGRAGSVGRMIIADSQHSCGSRVPLEFPSRAARRPDVIHVMLLGLGLARQRSLNHCFLTSCLAGP